MKLLILALLVCALVTAATAESMLSVQEGIQPFRKMWCADRIGVPSGDSVSIAFPTNYLEHNFQNADGVTVYIDGGPVEIFLVTAKKGIYWEYQRYPANTWWPFPDLDADSLKARSLGPACTLDVWVWER